MKLNYKSFGQGEPLIIIHGLFGMLDNWQTIAKRLSEDFMVYIVDMRNHGKSPHSDEMDYKVMAEDLKEFMESQWIYSAYVVGHSMGGKVAMQFAIDYDDMVKKLMVVDIAPKRYPPGHLGIFDALLSIDIDAISSRKEIDKILSDKISEISTVQFLLKNISRKKPKGYKWKMNLSAIHASYDNILSSIDPSAIDIPALFVKGGRSGYITKEDHELIQGQFTSSEILEISDVGHWVHAEAPERMIKVINDFFGNS